ncbi:heme exporter protein CcmD [Citrobacter sp. CF971]|uniref:heme exporter protein CcmD n=1 Tax=Citrobacter sp. CF971 TaxID=2566012 RepID=UPI001FEEDBB7|nr:heme exporter protein CcmD [Citrobacter sp. CF971]MEB0988598.1 heme exporter protein CcmD [Citrobacter freundii]
MTPAFASWSDFFAMGGYALYVWLAVAMSVIPLVVLVVHSTLQHRAILRGVPGKYATRSWLTGHRGANQSHLHLFLC